MPEGNLEEMVARAKEHHRQMILHSARNLPAISEYGKQLLRLREEGPPTDFFQIAEDDVGIHPLQAAVIMLAGLIDLSPEEWSTLQLCATLAELEHKNFVKEEGL